MHVGVTFFIMHVGVTFFIMHVGTSFLPVKIFRPVIYSSCVVEILFNFALTIDKQGIPRES